MAGFTPLWQQSFQLPLSIWLDSWHSFSPNQHSCFPSPFLLYFVFHVFFFRPRFPLPFNSNSNTFLKTCPSSLLNTPVPSHSIRLCHLNHTFLQSQNIPEIEFINYDMSLAFLATKLFFGSWYPEICNIKIAM